MVLVGVLSVPTLLEKCHVTTTIQCAGDFVIRTEMLHLDESFLGHAYSTMLADLTKRIWIFGEACALTRAGRSSLRLKCLDQATSTSYQSLLTYDVYSSQIKSSTMQD